MALSYEKAHLSDKDDVLEFVLTGVANEEAVIVALGASPDEWKRVMAAQVDEALKDPLISFVARDKSQGNQLAGVCLANVVTVADFLDYPNKIATMNIKDSVIDKALTFGQKILTETNISKDMEGKKLLQFQAFGVRKEYRMKGVGTKLSQMSLAASIENGCSHAVAVVYGSDSHRLVEKLGLQLKHSIGYADLLGPTGKADALPTDGTVAVFYNRIIP